MNLKRLFLTLVVAFVVLTATNYLIHAVWLKSTYAQDAGKIWRTETDMQHHMSGIFVGNFLTAIAFTLLWSRIALGGAGIQCAIGLGIFLTFFHSGSAVINHAVMPLPEGLLTKWLVAGLLQNVLVAVILYFVYRPEKACPVVTLK
jgi:hypothetical protein